MIVFDGDSTLVFEDFGTPEASSWPHLLAANRGHEYMNIAKQQSTAAKCRTRLWKALSLDPDWYVLQVGQWSAANEPIDDFERHVRYIVEFSKIHAVQPCLVGPPASVQWNTEEYSFLLRRLSTIYSVPFIELVSNSEVTWFIDDFQMCHLNEYGCRQIADIFNLAENLHICK